MSCREFERALDVYLASRGDGRETTGASPTLGFLERHAAGCPSCAEILSLATLPLGDDAGVAADVLTRTSGPACHQAEEGLNDFVTGHLVPGEDRSLLAEHLEHCSTCSALARELERLAVDLPRLAVVAPDTSLVPDVLRRTLPLPVQFRRWWASAWPRWVQRPRFAAELAYAATLVLVVIFGTPVSPLQATSERAIDFVRAEPLGQFEALSSEARGEITSKLQGAVDNGSGRVQQLVTSSRAMAGTISQEVASWFETAEDEPSAQDSTKQETP